VRSAHAPRRVSAARRRGGRPCRCGARGAARGTSPAMAIHCWCASRRGGNANASKSPVAGNRTCGARPARSAARRSGAAALGGSGRGGDHVGPGGLLEVAGVAHLDRPRAARLARRGGADLQRRAVPAPAPPADRARAPGKHRLLLLAQEKPVHSDTGVNITQRFDLFYLNPKPGKTCAQ